MHPGAELSFQFLACGHADRLDHAPASADQDPLLRFALDPDQSPHPREIVENLADRAHFPSVHQTEIDDFEFSVDGHMATQRVKGRALLPGGGVDRFGSTTTYHGPGLLLMRMGGVMQNYMIVAHTPVDSMSLELRMGVMLKNVAAATEMERLVALYMKNLKAGFEDDIRIWENKLYRDVPVLCDGDGPITQLRRWYRQFYVAREQPLAEQRA